MTDRNDVVIINLDRPRLLRFGHKALKTLSSLTGKGLDQLETDKFELEDLEKILYCGLLSDAKENNETLKLDDMEDLLDYAPFHEIMAKMQQAFQVAFGQFESDEKNVQGIAEKKKN